MNREDWLTQAAQEAAPAFELAGTALPKTRITCGFPSTWTLSKQTLGECWSDKASADGTFEVLVSPTISDSGAVFAVLLAQLCAASKADPVAMGLDQHGGMADGRWDSVIEDLGTYPHVAIVVGSKPVQTTRMLKAVCPSCGYTVRLTQKWASLGLPLCPSDVKHPRHIVELKLEASK
jgi:hypothetical protein